MVPSASGVGAHPARGRRPGQEQPGGQVGGEQPAAAGEDDPRPPPRSSSPCSASSATTGRGRGRRPRRPPASAARARTPPRRGSRRRASSEPATGDVARRDRGDVPLGRADVPPAAARRCGRARRSRCRRTRRRSSTARCAGTPRRAAPSSTPRTTRARPRASTVVGARVRVGLEVVVGRGRAGRDLAAERGRGLDRERVRADVVDAERERAVERSLPVGGRLARRAVDEIDVDAREPGVAGELDRAPDVRGIVRAAERGEHVRHHRLHAEAQAVRRPPRRYARELGRVDAVGIALDRDLGAVGAVDRVEDPRELRRPGSATACRRRRTRSSPRACPRRAGASMSATHASTYVVDQVVAVGPRREVAVVAPRRAERDVDVDAEGHAPSSRGPAPRRGHASGGAGVRASASTARRRARARR